ncbi:MAG: PilC/PilY family type IV pilus protein [Burkholderiaceae bacterium]|nr:PilC/PilY family type IV pilus protein [Burkholderiaceae bacterium]
MKTSYAVIALVMSMVVNSASAELSVIPPNIVSTTQNKPMVMLTASKDVTMFWKAYTDFEDIDFDGKVDYTFKPAFEYYGYFDPKKCYTYNTAAEDGRFEPAAASTQDASGNNYCTSGTGQWSGNFLNWATMSRMDILRKVLYGGLRSGKGVDTAARYAAGDSETSTTLELSFVPRNSQAFVKYYNGSDLNQLTPYNNDNNPTAMSKGITLCRRTAEDAGVSSDAAKVFTPQIRVAVGNYILWNMTEVRSCNWSGEIGYTWKGPTVDFLKNNYISPNGSKGVDNANYVHPLSVPANPAQGAVYGGIGPNLTARVQVCASADKLEPGCKLYGTVYKPTGLLHEFGESTDSGNKAARAEFGLLMGSYDHNIEAGILRKNMGEINDEINPATGQFILNGALTKGGIIRSFNEITLYGYNVGTGNYGQTCQSDTLTNGNCPSWGNPVGEMLLESTRYFAGKLPSKAPGDKDTAIGLPTTVDASRPVDAPSVWTDPMSTYSDDFLVKGITKRSTLYGRGICRPLNMLTISGGVNSWDGVNGLADVPSLPTFSHITDTATAAALTKIIGDKEGITNTTRLVGNSGAASPDLMCTGKNVTDLALVQGACPDGPNFRGTYLGAGVAGYANTHRVRADLDAKALLIPDLPYNAMTVRNYGVTMSGGTATIEVPLPGQTECSAANGGLANPDCKRVYITPASLDSQRGAPGPLPGNMVDFKVLSRSDDGKSGAALVLWQHSMLGEDQDQDQLDSIRWQVGGTDEAPTITIYTQAVESDTGSAAPFGFGYTLLGTDKDGLHMHSGINKFLVADPTGVNVVATAAVNGPDDGTKCVAAGGNPAAPKTKLCSKLGAAGNVVQGETYKTFNMTGATNASLKEPLWYIAKYGGFKYNKDDKAAAADLYPTRTTQWDTRKADGTQCNNGPGEPCDGNPDNYFYARRPDLLEKSLREILEEIVTSSNTAPAISASQLQAGDLKVVAAFDGEDGSGALTAFALKANGVFASGEGNEAWKAHTELTNMPSALRQVITNRTTAAAAIDNTGIPFEWDSLNDTEKSALSSIAKKGGESDADFSTRKLAYNQRMLEWLRGSTDNKAEFRTRPATSIMGPIVNSNPTIQTRPQGRYFGDAFAGYGDFVSTWKNRRLVLWAGAGDGMLHAFDASSDKVLGGKPILSYIPQPLFTKLQNWASPTGAKVQAMVDGSPFVGDVKVGADWHTYLFSSLGRGGKGIFALDVTKAGKLTTVTDDKGTPADKSDDTTTTTLAGSELDETVAHAKSIFRWQLTNTDEAAANDDLGYIVSEPTTSIFTNQPGQIAMMNNGRFAALFGNGVESTHGRAVLYIVFADADSTGNGGKFVKITTPIAGGNGLSQPTWVDVNNDRKADYIYAGDLKGNLWRFDVSSNNSADWKVSYKALDSAEGKPLFTAKDAADNPLPITGAPEFRFARMGGVVVSVVTGLSLSSGDFPNTTRTHGMFGIWDNPAFSLIDTNVAMEAALPRTLDQLAERVLHNTADNKSRYLTGDPVNWQEDRGWYLFFNVSSEMGLNNLTIANDQLVTVTVSPAPEKLGLDTDACSDTPVARLLAVDPITGLPSELLGTYTDPVTLATYSLASIGIADQKLKFGGTQLGTEGVDCKSGNLDCTIGVGATGQTNLNSSLGKGRIFWREIPGLKTN